MLPFFSTFPVADPPVIAPSSTKRLIGHFAHLLPDEQKADPDVLSGLTEREREVLMLIARGMSNTEIATELFVAEAEIRWLDQVEASVARFGATASTASDLDQSVPSDDAAEARR